MSNNDPWSRLWTLLDADGSGKTLIPEASQFRLEAQPGVGDVTYYRLRAGIGIDKRFDGRPFYPVGVRDLTAGSLPKWNAHDANVRNLYLAAAESVKAKGRADPLATRLESTFRLNGSSA